MKTFKMTAAAAAVAAATLVAAPLQAAIQLDGLPLGSKFAAAPGQGELFVSIVARGSEAAENRSYVRDLGITANTFVQALLGGTLGSLSYSIGPDATLSNFLSTHAGKAISFNLTAVNNPGGYDPNTFDTLETGYLSTSGESFDATEAKMPKDISQTPSSNAAIESFVQAANLATDGSPTGDPAQNFSLLRAPGDFGFHDNNFGGSATFGFNTEGEMGGMVDFYFLELHNFEPYELHALGKWSLLGDGTLEFTPVPLPAAAWMLGSGIIGLAGLARRRRTSA